MKPSPGENKFGDGDSCGMHGLRFSASPDGDGHLPPSDHPGGSAGHTEAAAPLPGKLAPHSRSPSRACWQRCNRRVTNR